MTYYRRIPGTAEREARLRREREERELDRWTRNRPGEYSGRIRSRDPEVRRRWCSFYGVSFRRASRIVRPRSCAHRGDPESDIEEVDSETSSTGSSDHAIIDDDDWASARGSGRSMVPPSGDFIVTALQYQAAFHLDGEPNSDAIFWERQLEGYAQLWQSAGLLMENEEFVEFMRSEPAAKRTMPNTSLPPLKRPFNGLREQPIGMYDRTRHLDLSVCMENLALVKRTVRENEGSPLPDEWRLRLRDQQRQCEQIVESTYFETAVDESEDPFTLVDAKMGVISKARLPYVLKHVRMNGRHVQYMLKHLKEMPSELEAHYASIDSVADTVDLGAYVPSHPRLKSIMRRFMKEDVFDDPKSWAQTTWENDQEKLRVLENRVKAYLLDIERRYKGKIHYGFGGANLPEGEEMPEVELPADFIAMREASRARSKAKASSEDSCPELEGSVAGSDAAESEVTQVNSSAATNSSVHSDGLLVEDEIIDQLLENTVQSVQASLSSMSINTTPGPTSETPTSSVEKSRSPQMDAKRADEIAGLRAAISNAVEKGSCSADKMSIVDRALQQPPPAPESPPDAPRDPRDRRKRIRSGCFRYVARSDTPNSIASLVSELKLIFSEDAVGLKLCQIFTALDGHPDKPLSDTWSGPEHRFRFKEIRGDTLSFSFNMEVKFFYLFRFLFSHCIKPEYYIQFCEALSNYAVDYTTRMSICDAFDHITRGQRPASMSADEVQAGFWIPEKWAVVGESRTLFVQSVLERFCGPLINELKLPPGTIIATEFTIGTDPAMMSIVDQLIASLLGYNWSIVGYLSCTDYSEQDNLDAISRFEFTKARDFLENWLRTEGYKCLSIGERSSQFKVNLFESIQWKNGIIVGLEAESPRDFYQINRSFVKVNVNETIHKFGDEIWDSTNPMDFCKKVSQLPVFCCMILTIINGKTFVSEYPELRDLATLKRNHHCMFVFQESTASRGGNFSVGRQLNITDGVELSDLDEYDEVVRQKIQHSGRCHFIRRLFSTISFNPKLLKQNAFTAVCAEFLKTLASSFCRTQVMDTLGRGPNSRGSQKYRWVTTYELSCLTDKLNHQVGSNVVFDLSTMDCNLRDHRICFVSTILVFQVATLGTYGNRCNRSRHYVFPPSLIRAQGWAWLIELTHRISMGRQMELSAGDFLLKLINITSQIYEPLVQLTSPRIPPEIQETNLYRHPHSWIAAKALVSSGQFSHCELCKATTCPVNVLYARLFACVYFFVRNISGLTGEKFGVGTILSSARTSFVLKHLAVENFDASGFLTGYQIRSDINLVFPTDIMEDPTEPSGIHREKMHLEYILADFDSTKHNRFNSTYEMLSTLLSKDGVSSVTKKYVTTRQHDYCNR